MSRLTPMESRVARKRDAETFAGRKASSRRNPLLTKILRLARVAAKSLDAGRPEFGEGGVHALRDRPVSTTPDRIPISVYRYWPPVP